MNKTKSRVAIFLWLLALGGSGVSVLGFFGNLDWRVDLLSHFRLQYVLLFSVLILISGILKRYRLLILSGVFLILNASLFLPFYLPRPAGNEANSLTIFMANVERGNRRTDLLLQEIAAVRPEILVLVEIDPRWMRELTILKQQYPYEVAAVRSDYSGVLLLSKLPLQASRVEEVGTTNIPMVVANVVRNGKRLTLLGLHPYAPFDRWAAMRRDEQLLSAAHYVKTQKNPTVLLGDLNITPFSAVYQDIQKNALLTDCAVGFGYQITWQLQPLLAPIGLSIDHCMYTAGVRVVKSSVGDTIGSDHKPIINTISW